MAEALKIIPQHRRLIGYLRRWPVLPVAGSGESKQQPVYVDDVAWAVVRCLDAAGTAGGVTLTDGWDFSLPAGVEPAPYAGLFPMDGRTPGIAAR